MISRVPRSHYCFFPKTASIIGTFLVATTTSLTGNASFGVLSIAVLLVVALVFLLLRIPLPQPVEKTVSDIGGMATPYCLIVLGGSIHLSRFGDYGRSLWLAVLGKSVIIPLVFIPLVVLAGFRGDALAALAVMLACPTAVSGYTLANQCGADGELAAQLIVVTTLFSVVTMFLTIWVLTSMALI